MTETLIHRIGELAEKYPSKTAVIFKEESLTYRELYTKALSIGARLRDTGVGPAVPVCFSAVSKPEMVGTYLGCQSIGTVAVFLDKSATPEHMAEIYRASGAKLLLTDKPMKNAEQDCNVVSLREVYASDVQPLTDVYVPKSDEITEILFTTGTTGKPKGVMLSCKAVYNILMNTIRGCGYNADTVMLLPLPLNHSFALRVLRAVLYAGGTVVLQNGFTFAREAENNITSFGCNSIAVVPASYEVMKGQMQDAFQPVMSKLISFEAGAGSLSIGQRRDLVKKLPKTRIMNVWGSSESGGAIFCNVNEVVTKDDIAGSLGRVLDSVEVMFLSEDSPFEEPKKMEGHLKDWQVMADAEHPGRMAIKGDMIMSGYWDEPEKTAETLIDGWLVTGDMAYSDSAGNIFMLGRADDIINVGGEKVSPIEMENTVGQYEHIRDCACIGVADELLGQAPVLFVVTGLGYDEAAFRKWLSSRVERNKLSQKIIVVEEIPRNRMKKIDRKGLRKLWENRGSLELVNPVIDAILSRRSVRKFTDQEIPKDMLELILKCGYHAPSGHNMQSWKFTVLTIREDIERLKEAAVVSAKRNKVFMHGFENPKVVVLVSNDKRNPDGCQDASCAAENMMLAAQSFGIGSVWINVLMNIRNEEPVKTVLDEFGVPENHTVWASVALGWPVNDGVRLGKKADVICYV